MTSEVSYPVILQSIVVFKIRAGVLYQIQKTSAQLECFISDKAQLRMF